MSLVNSLRKGLRFFLMSFGVSTPAKKSASSVAQKPPLEPRK